MRSQQDVREHLCALIDEPTLDPVGFKREALLEYADRNTVLYVRRVKLGKSVLSEASVTDWHPVRLEVDEIKKHLFSHFARAWQSLKRTNSNDKHVVMLRILDKIEAAFWILEDQEAINFIRTPKGYEHSAVLLMAWLSDRYGFVPE